ncbi:MAG: RlmE family RNA methyltransferase [Candidatus Gracilibacteria bacterium]|nr:RlmE family RNA methyltransferase [Candidatus Gracilibacteria bacterium]
MAKRNRIQNKKNHAPKTGFHRKKKVQRGKYVINDEFAEKARKAGFRARSIYKLLEMQERFELIKPDYSVIDIGCAPGSFIQAIRNIVREKTIIGVDLKPVKPFSYPNVSTIVCDIFDYEKLNKEVIDIIGESQFDLITSDIAPNTTGRFDVDQYASVELNIEICKFSDWFLKEGGNMILKVFKGEDFNDLAQEVKKRFKNMQTYKPLACRDSSHEEYIICYEKKPVSVK